MTKLPKDYIEASSEHLQLQRTLGSHHLKPKGPTRGFLMCPDNKTFWSLSSGLFRWDATTGEQLEYIDTNASSALLQGKVLVVVVDGSLVQLRGKRLGELPKRSRYFSAYNAAMSQDASLILLSSVGQHRLYGPKLSASYQKKWEARRAFLLPKGDGILLFEDQYLKPTEESKGRTLFFITVLAPTKKERWRVETLAWPIGAAFLIDHVVISFYDGTLSCLALKTGALAWTLKLSERPLHAPASSQRRDLIVDDGETLFLVKQGKVQASIPNLRIMSDHQVAISPEGDWLVVCEERELLRIIELPTGKERLFGSGHASEITGLSWLSPSQLLSTATLDQQVRLWDTRSGETSWMAELPKNAKKLVLAPDGRSFCVAYDSGQIEQRDLELGSRLFSCQVERGAPSALAFSPDGSLLFAATGTDSRATENILYAWETGQSDSTPLWIITGNLYNSPKDLSLTQNNQYLWVFSSGAANRYQARTGRSTMRSSTAYPESIERASLLSDGMTAIGFIDVLDDSGYYSNTFLRRWDLDSGKIEWSTTEHIATPLLISRDETWAIRARFDAIYLHSLSEGKRFDELALKALNDSISCIALSPDEETLAVGTQRGLIFLYQVVGLP
jgi:WD40 repeat protein